MNITKKETKLILYDLKVTVASQQLKEGKNGAQISRPTFYNDYKSIGV